MGQTEIKENKRRKKKEERRKKKENDKDKQHITYKI